MATHKLHSILVVVGLAGVVALVGITLSVPKSPPSGLAPVPEARLPTGVADAQARGNAEAPAAVGRAEEERRMEVSAVRGASATPPGETGSPEVAPGRASGAEAAPPASWAFASDAVQGTDVREPAATPAVDRPADPDRPELRQCLDVLRMPWQEKNNRREELQAAIEKLAAMGDEVIEPIMREFEQYDQTFTFRHKAVQVFEAMRTPKARDTLLQIALGATPEKTRSLKEWAARAYLASLDTKSEAIRLLSSRDTGVLNKALLALKGEPVDAMLLSHLQKILERNELPLCWAAAALLAEDPTAGYAREKCALLIRAITLVPQLARANEIYPQSHYSYAETVYARYIEAFIKMHGVEGLLRYLTPSAFTPSDRVRECLLIARARRGEPSVAGDLGRILQDSRADMFRAWAALGLGQIGTEREVPLLRRAADSDPLVRDRGISVPLPQQQFFPVREAAAQALKMIEARR